MRWDQLDLALRHQLLEWHAPIWERLVAWGLDPLGDLRGKRVLEIGCGHGGLSCLLALCEAEVYATDISFYALERARQLADSIDMTGHVYLFCADAHFPPTPNGRFDLIITRSVLVTCDRQRIVPWLARLLSPNDGIGLFVENMRRDPTRNLQRRIKSKSKRSYWSHLPFSEIDIFRRHFRDVETRFAGLSYPVAGLLGRLSSRFEKFAAPPLMQFDHALFALIPKLSAYAWLVALRCSSPRASPLHSSNATAEAVCSPEREDKCVAPFSPSLHP